ncbi:hypothetical protein SRABI128_05171 [Microbacterium sp. Bi128]|nr:hypothetical protein SRABI128_05171 [Microbacterium sp. Bi128]
MALFLNHADRVLVAVRGQLGAHGLTGELLVGTEVGECSELGGDRFTGVEAHNRDAGVGGLLQDVLEGFGLGERDRDAVDLLVNGLLNELGLAPGFGIGRIEELNVVLRRCLLGALANNIPEGVTGCGVRDKGDLDAGGAGCLASASRIA